MSGLRLTLNAQHFTILHPDWRPSGQQAAPEGLCPGELRRNDDRDHPDRLQGRPANSPSRKLGKTFPTKTDTPHVLDDPVPCVALKGLAGARRRDRSFQKERRRPPSEAAGVEPRGVERQMREQAGDRRVQEPVGRRPEQAFPDLSQEVAVWRHGLARRAQDDLAGSPAGSEKAFERKWSQSPVRKTPREPGRGGAGMAQALRNDGNSLSPHVCSWPSLRGCGGPSATPAPRPELSYHLPPATATG